LSPIAFYASAPPGIIALISLIFWVRTPPAARARAPHHNTTTTTQGQLSETSAKKQINSPQEHSPVTVTYPVVGNNLKKDFFVDVLNQGGYSIDGKSVVIPSAGMPVKFTRDGNKNFEENLDQLRVQYAIRKQVIIFQFEDLTTEQAINNSTLFTIALNFANEHHAGGGPGFHLDNNLNSFVYDAPSAEAQEESLCQRSDLMASLTRLPHTLKADAPSSNFIRSYYCNGPFDSREVAYVSQNHLFAVQASYEFYPSSYLAQPKPVTFITSAGAYHGNKKLDCSKNSEAYNDAKRRIETHLLAAASSAGIVKANQPNQHVELILGAFGCGAFAPAGNPDEYRQMIANIYKELTLKFQGFFDVITFAVPTFGDNNPTNPAVANHNIFKNILEF
jgi:uncharacterized protein (TIGR02452 family)